MMKDMPKSLSDVNDELLNRLLEEGYSQKEAEERLLEIDEEEEHLGFLRFQELHERNR